MVFLEGQAAMGQCPYVALWPPLHLAGFYFIFQLLWWGLGRQKTPRLYENTGMLGGNCSKLCLCSSCLACLYPGCVASGSLGGAYSPGCSESLGEAFAPEEKKKSKHCSEFTHESLFFFAFRSPKWDYFLEKSPLHWMGILLPLGS